MQWAYVETPQWSLQNNSKTQSKRFKNHIQLTFLSLNVRRRELPYFIISPLWLGNEIENDCEVQLEQLADTATVIRVTDLNFQIVTSLEHKPSAK